jgi:transcriptional regulator with XRE-family HTH domain
MPADWWAYVTRTAGMEATQKDIAERAEMEQSSLSRWKLGKNPPDAENVVRFARAYGKPPVGALIAAGYLEPHEADQVVEIDAKPISKLSISELVAQLRELFAELQRRIPMIGDIINDVTDDSEDWAEGFSEGDCEQPPPVRGRKHRK